MTHKLAKRSRKRKPDRAKTEKAAVLPALVGIESTRAMHVLGKHEVTAFGSIPGALPSIMHLVSGYKLCKVRGHVVALRCDPYPQTGLKDSVILARMQTSSNDMLVQRVSLGGGPVKGLVPTARITSVLRG